MGLDGAALDARVRRNRPELALRRARTRRLDGTHAPVLRRLRAAAAQGGRLAQRRRRRRGAEALVQDRPSVDARSRSPRPTGRRFQESGTRAPGAYDVAFPPLPPPPAPPEPAPTEPLPPAEGRWTFTVSSTDDQGLPSTTTRRFAVNSTLGSLRVAPTRVVVRPTGGRADILWSQARGARVKVTIETPEGSSFERSRSRPSRPASSRHLGRQGGNRKPVAGGRYVARVTATNELGFVALAPELTVRRVKA